MTGVFRLHPETYAELYQTGHPPDVHVICHILAWELESVICGKAEWNRELILIERFEKRVEFNSLPPILASIFDVVDVVVLLSVPLLFKHTMRVFFLCSPGVIAGWEFVNVASKPLNLPLKALWQRCVFWPRSVRCHSMTTHSMTNSLALYTRWGWGVKGPVGNFIYIFLLLGSIFFSLDHSRDRLVEQTFITELYHCAVRI